MEVAVAGVFGYGIITILMARVSRAVSIILLVLGLAGGLVWAACTAWENYMMAMPLGDGAKHAFIVHGAESEQAYNCLKQHGIKSQYKELRNPKEPKNKFAWHFLCQDLMGTIFDVIIGDNLKSGTAFSPKAGSWEAVKKWLESPLKRAHYVRYQQVPLAVREAIESFLSGSAPVP